MKSKTMLFLALLLLYESRVQLFAVVEREQSAPGTTEETSRVAAAQKVQQTSIAKNAATQHTVDPINNHKAVESATLLHKPVNSGLSLGEESLPQASIVPGAVVDENNENHAVYVDATQPVQGELPDSQEASADNYLFNNWNKPQEVHAVDEQAKSIHKESFTKRYVDYSNRRIDQVDPIKAKNAINNIDQSIKNIDVDGMSDAEFARFDEYRDKFELIKKQYKTDVTQLKSQDLADFLNDFKQFSENQVEQSEKQLTRSLWQKMFDAIQDFFDLLNAKEVQPVPIALTTSIPQEPIQSQNFIKNPST